MGSKTPSETPEDSALRAADLAARQSYSRLIAYLSSRTGDLAAAEDALADAFQRALQNWPKTGVPDHPEAWLLATARHRLIDEARRGRVRKSAAPTLHLIQEEADFEKMQDPFIPDERLKLLFVCAHPAIDPAARTPLMLQTVLGVDAKRMASAFLLSPAAMSQRLVRAKQKIRNAGMSFTLPDADQLADRLQAVLEAIYAAFGTDWDDFSDRGQREKNLTAEALWLARLVVELMPQQAEAKGLLALMLYCEARRGARRSPEQAYIALSEQNTALWSRPMIEEAEQILAQALALGPLGPYQLEASIQSAHSMRLTTHHNNWRDIVEIYDRLATLAPTIGVLISRAAALAELSGPEAGLNALAALEEKSTKSHQPYWAVRADLLRRLGRISEAKKAYRLAIGLSEDPAIRAYLEAKHSCL